MSIQLKKLKINKTLLRFALFLLIITTFLSLLANFKLRDTINSYKESMMMKERMDHLNIKFKSWIILNNTNQKELNNCERKGKDNLCEIQKGGQEKLKKEMEKEIEESLLTIKNLIIDDPLLNKNTLNLVQTWNQIKNSTKKLDTNLLILFKEQVDILDNVEIKKNLIHELSIDRIFIFFNTFCLLVAIFIFIIIYHTIQIVLYEIEERNQLLIELEKSKEQAVEASKIKSMFLATVSHEIRTPLNSIIGLSDVLKNTQMPAKEHQFIKLIHNSGKSLLKIINDILDFSKIESGKIIFEKSEFSLIDVAEQIVHTMSSVVSNKPINLSYQIDEELPQKIWGDSDRLCQVLYNLVGNAIKFTSAGSVIIKFEKNLVFEKQLNLNSSKVVQITFSVEDTGIGMNQTQIGRLFEPFVQLHKEGTFGEAGTGLGLSISQHLVRMMGGEIQVSSEKDIGSKFWFTLSFQDFSSEIIGLQLKQKNNKSKINKIEINPIFYHEPRPCIMVVEDNPTNLITAQIILNRLGAEVLSASNGKEALDLVSKTKIDLILMDCQMPIMNGFEASLALKNGNIKIPIIAMTANASIEDEKKCLAAQMDGFLSKPITIDSLAKGLKKFIKTSELLIKIKILNELESKIGYEAKVKVLTSFVSDLPNLRKLLSDSLREKDLNHMKRIAHQYKSSSLVIGAECFSIICCDLEKTNSLDEGKTLCLKLMAMSHDLETEIYKNQLIAKTEYLTK